MFSPKDAIAINKDCNKASTPWVNYSLLESAFSSYGYYGTWIEQVCSVYRGLVKNHAFSDGNKRTGAIILAAYVEQHGYEFPDGKLYELTIDVATHNYDVDEIVSKLLEVIVVK